jgi:DNA-binding transcriptional LysR family regulator
LNVETLLDEAIVVVVNAKSRWAGRRKIALKELQGEPWILAPGKNVARSLVEDAFRAEGLIPPRPHVTTYSMQLRMQLLSRGRYITVFTDTTARYSAERWSLEVLPIELGRRLPVVAVTLKHRSPTPSVQAFLEDVRVATRSMQSSAVLT